MIYLIAGRPRSGKSYESVRYHIIPAIKEGRKVITNVPLNIEHFKKVFGDEVENLIVQVGFDYSDFESSASVFPFSKPEDYQDEWRNEKGQGPLFVIDEAHFSMPRGGTLKSVQKFYTMHGHYGIDILLMSQRPRQIDGTILDLVEIVYRTIKNTALGSNSTYTKKVQDGWRGSVVNTEQRKYDSKYFPFYKSHTQSDKAVIEKEASDIKPVWKHWSVYGFGLCIVAFLFIVMNYNVNPLAVPEAEKPSVKKVESEPRFEKISKPQVSVQSEVKVSKFPFEHPYYRVDLHVSGSADIGSYDNLKHLVFFSATKNGEYLFDVEMKDLILAGYEVVVMSRCLVIIKFEDYMDYLTCDESQKHKGIVDQVVSN